MRPSAFSRGGGGFLNGVDATITGYSFTAGQVYEVRKGNRKGEEFQPLNLVPTFRVDGASEDVSKRMLVGNTGDFGDLSEDGLTLNLGGGRFRVESDAGVFVESLFKPTGGGEGFPEDRIDEDVSKLNLEPIIGTRVRLVTINALDAKGNPKTHQGKNAEGKEQTYPDKNVVVETVYEVPRLGAKAATKTAGKATAKPTKANGKALDVTQESAEAIVTVLTAKGGVIAKPKLRMALLTLLTGKSEHRDAIIAFLSKDENLDAIAATANIEHDADAISLAVA